MCSSARTKRDLAGERTKSSAYCFVVVVVDYLCQESPRIPPVTCSRRFAFPQFFQWFFPGLWLPAISFEVLPPFLSGVHAGFGFPGFPAGFWLSALSSVVLPVLLRFRPTVSPKDFPPFVGYPRFL